MLLPFTSLGVGDIFQDLAPNSHAENENQEVQLLRSGGKEPSSLAPSFLAHQAWFPPAPHGALWVRGQGYTGCPPALSS